MDWRTGFPRATMDRKPGPSETRPLASLAAVPRALAVALATSLLSLLLVAPAPSYDPWAWLLWGREVAGGGLSTLEGPAFKPLPVAVCALLAPLGAAAPWLWVLLVRVAAAVAAAGSRSGSRGGWRAARGRRARSARSRVLLCGALPAYTAAGAEPALRARARARRRGRVARRADAASRSPAPSGCALLRVEAWPFAARRRASCCGAGGRRTARCWPRSPSRVPAAWLVPELIGSGDLLRSGARARVPNPGQPALADVPGAGGAARRRSRCRCGRSWAGRRRRCVGALRAARARRSLPAAAGAAWIALVALMAQAGFSGEPRYALPGRRADRAERRGRARRSRRCAARRAAHGALARRRARRARRASPPCRGSPTSRDAARRRRRTSGGWPATSPTRSRPPAARDAVLACGRPYVGPLRGPLMAYRIDVAKHVVEPDDAAAPARRGLPLGAARAPSAPAPDAPAAVRRGRARRHAGRCSPRATAHV